MTVTTTVAEHGAIAARSTAIGNHADAAAAYQQQIDLLTKPGAAGSGNAAAIATAAVLETAASPAAPAGEDRRCANINPGPTN